MRAKKSSKINKTSKSRKYKCQKVARITNNGYLNYLREFKKSCCGLSPQDMVRYGARAWNKLSTREKEKYTNMGKKFGMKTKGSSRKSRQSVNRSLPKICQMGRSRSKSRRLKHRRHRSKSRSSQHRRLRSKSNSRTKSSKIVCPNITKSSTSRSKVNRTGSTSSKIVCPKGSGTSAGSKVSLKRKKGKSTSSIRRRHKKHHKGKKHHKRTHKKSCSNESSKNLKATSKSRIDSRRKKGNSLARRTKRKAKSNNWKSQNSLLGSVIAYMNYVRAFCRKYGTGNTLELMKCAARYWRNLPQEERIKYEHRPKTKDNV